MMLGNEGVAFKAGVEMSDEITKIMSTKYLGAVAQPGMGRRAMAPPPFEELTLFFSEFYNKSMSEISSSLPPIIIKRPLMMVEKPLDMCNDKPLSNLRRLSVLPMSIAEAGREIPKVKITLTSQHSTMSESCHKALFVIQA